MILASKAIKVIVTRCQASAVVSWGSCRGFVHMVLVYVMVFEVAQASRDTLIVKTCWETLLFLLRDLERIVRGLVLEDRSRSPTERSEYHRYTRCLSHDWEALYYQKICGASGVFLRCDDSAARRFPHQRFEVQRCSISVGVSLLSLR